MPQCRYSWHRLPAFAADAGLHVGEIRALEWGDLDLVAARVTVQRTDYRGHVGSPLAPRHEGRPTSHDPGALGGHATITTTMGYMHLTPSAARAAVDLLEKPIGVAASWQHEGSGTGSD